MNKENKHYNNPPLASPKIVPIQHSAPASVFRSEKVLISDLLKNCNQAEPWQNVLNSTIPFLRPQVNVDTLLSICNKKLLQRADHSRALYLRATCYLKKNLFYDAISDCDKLLQVDPTNTKPRYVRACCLQKLGRINEAIVDLNHVLGTDQHCEQALLQRACCFNKLGMFQRAIQDYALALQQGQGAINAHGTIGLDDPHKESERQVMLPCQAIPNQSIRDESTTMLSDSSTVLDQLNRSTPNNSLSKHEQAQMMHRKGYEARKANRLDEALFFYSKSLELNPSSHKVLFNRGFIYNRIGQHAQAIKDYSAAIELDATNPYAFYNLGIAYNKAGLLSQAIEAISDAISIDQKKPDFYYSRAMVYRKMEHFSASVQDSSICLKLSPKHAKALCNRAFCLQRLNQTSLAQKDYQSALSLSTKDLSVTYYYGSFLMQCEGREKEALKQFNSALKVDGQYAPAYNARGLLFDRMGNHPAACMDFTKALTYWQNSVFYQNRACCLRNMGKLAQAIQDFNKALELDPCNPLIHSNLGLLYRKMKDYGKAADQFHKEFEQSESWTALNNKGFCLAMQGKLSQAISTFTLSISMQQNLAALQYRGTCYERTRDAKRAVQDFSRAIELSPKDANLYFSRGSCYDSMGLIKQAVADYSTAFQLDSLSQS